MVGKREFTSLRKKHDRFKWSQPYGYDFQEVDETFDSFQSKLAEIEEYSNSVILTKDSIISQLKAENERLSSEIVALNIQLQSVVAPTRSVDESVNILSDFMEVEETKQINLKQPQQKSSLTPPTKRRPVEQNNTPQQTSNSNNSNNNNNPYGSGGHTSLPIIE